MRAPWRLTGVVPRSERSYGHKVSLGVSRRDLQGIRHSSVFPYELGPDVARRFGNAFVGFTGSGRVIVGRDTRVLKGDPDLLIIGNGFDGVLRLSDTGRCTCGAGRRLPGAPHARGRDRLRRGPDPQGSVPACDVLNLVLLLSENPTLPASLLLTSDSSWPNPCCRKICALHTRGQSRRGRHPGRQAPGGRPLRASRSASGEVEPSTTCASRSSESARPCASSGRLFPRRQRLRTMAMVEELNDTGRARDLDVLSANLVWLIQQWRRPREAGDLARVLDQRALPGADRFL